MATAGNPDGLIDTDILIDAERGVSAAVDFLAAQHASSNLRVSIISAMELVVGCRDALELGRLRQFLRQVSVVPVDIRISQDGYQLMDLYRLGSGLLIPDALTAATALERGLTLYTKIVRHFQMIPGLSISRPNP